MAEHDDQPDRPAGPGRRVRIDGMPRPSGSAVVPAARTGADALDDPRRAPLPGVSGTLVVSGLVVGVLVLWGSLNVAFRVWRSAYRERAAYGVARVADAIVPLAEVVPAGEVAPAVRAAGGAGLAAPIAASAPIEVVPAAWQRAVAETRAMLVTLTAANLMSRDQMTTLGAAIDARVARATAQPETARAELAALWDEIERRAGPNVIGRHPRPRLLRPFLPPPSSSARWPGTRNGPQADARPRPHFFKRYEFPV